MPGDLLHVRAVNDQLAFGDPHRQQLTDALPGHGIEVLQIGDVAFWIYGAVHDPGSIVRMGRQRE